MIIREAIEYRVRHLTMMQEAIAASTDVDPNACDPVAAALRADTYSEHPERFIHTLAAVTPDIAEKLTALLSEFTRTAPADLIAILCHDTSPHLELNYRLWLNSIDRTQSEIRRGLDRIGISIEINAAIHFADNKSLYLETDTLITDLKAHDPFNGITTIVDDPYSLVA